MSRYVRGRAPRRYAGGGILNWLSPPGVDNEAAGATDEAGLTDDQKRRKRQVQIVNDLADSLRRAGTQGRASFDSFTQAPALAPGVISPASFAAARGGVVRGARRLVDALLSRRRRAG